MISVGSAQSMIMKSIRGLCAAFALSMFVVLSGCASYLSSESREVHPGLVYYLPMRPIIAQVVVSGSAQDPIETPSIATAPAIPDTAHRYVLTTMPNLISENHVSLSVSSDGLLQSANSTVTSGLSTILSNVASAVGTVHGLAARISTQVIAKPSSKRTPTDDCQIGKTYNLLFWPGTHSTQAPLCGWTVTTAPAPTTTTAPAPTTPTGTCSDRCARRASRRANRNSSDTTIPGSSSGVFYRTEQPYIVTFQPIGSTNAADSQSFEASSPDHSPTYFLPIERTLFANNAVTLLMKDGELASFEQDNGGEIVGFASIPANVISNYFAAISNIVPKRISATNAQMAAAVAQLQLQRCQLAITANPLKSGMSAADQDTALSNIKAACTAAAVPGGSQ